MTAIDDAVGTSDDFARLHLSYMQTACTTKQECLMDWTLEVVVLPVSDINRSIAFYRDQVGFHLDHETRNEHMHVAQWTPPGSGCSIVFGDLASQKQMEPGSMKALQLVVANAPAARQALLDRSVEVSDLMVIAETDGGTFFGFSDPDGNSWAVQRSKLAPTPAHPERSHGLGRMGRTLDRTRGFLRGRLDEVRQLRRAVIATPRFSDRMIPETAQACWAAMTA